MSEEEAGQGTGNEGENQQPYNPADHGWVQGDKVDQIRSESYAKGKAALEAEMSTMQQRIADLTAQNEAAKSGKGKASAEMEEMRQELRNMRERMEEKDREASRNKFAAEITRLATHHKLDEQGSEVLELYAQKALRQREDGSLEYKLPEGGYGTIQDFTDQWVKQSGERYQPSSHVGGFGTSAKPAAPTVKLESAADKIAYKQKYGEDALQEVLLKQSKERVQTRLSQR